MREGEAGKPRNERRTCKSERERERERAKERERWGQRKRRRKGECERHKEKERGHESAEQLKRNTCLIKCARQELKLPQNAELESHMLPDRHECEHFCWFNQGRLSSDRYRAGSLGGTPRHPNLATVRNT